MLLACNKSGTAIHVKKTEKRYELVAEYPERKTKKLEAYLKTAFENGDKVLHDEQINTGKEISFANGTVFYLRYNLCKLEMEMLVERNNTTGHRYFDEMAEGVKQALE